MVHQKWRQKMRHSATRPTDNFAKSRSAEVIIARIESKMNLLRDLLNAIAEPRNGSADAGAAAMVEDSAPRRQRRRSRGSSSRRSSSEAAMSRGANSRHSQSPPASRQSSERQDSNESPDEKKSFDM